MICMKNNSRCSGKNEGIGSLVSYYQPIVVPVRKTLTRVWMVPVARLIVPESGKARQKVGIAIAWDRNVHRSKFSKILGHQYRKWELAQPIARWLETKHLRRKSPPEYFLCRVVSSHPSLLCHCLNALPLWWVPSWQ